MEYADQLSEWSGFYVPYVETSAKTGLNVEKVFSLLTDNISQYFERMMVEYR
jgi:hypothetical protein